MQEAEELLDQVNPDDEVVGRVTRAQVWSDGIKYVRFVAGFLTNENGEIWVPIRSHTKKQLPGAYDWSFAGHVGSGEAYDAAAVRELEEELNISIENIQLHKSIKLTPLQHDIGYFVQVYDIPYNETPNFNKEDFESGSWMSRDELSQKLMSGAPAKAELHRYVKNKIH